eukprot:8374504-Pyramimonas_sp.AAC.1
MDRAPWAQCSEQGPSARGLGETHSPTGAGGRGREDRQPRQRETAEETPTEQEERPVRLDPWRGDER